MPLSVKIGQRQQNSSLTRPWKNVFKGLVTLQSLRTRISEYSHHNRHKASMGHWLCIEYLLVASIGLNRCTGWSTFSLVVEHEDVAH